MKISWFLVTASLLFLGSAEVSSASISDNEIRVAILTDLRSIYRDDSGQGGIIAAELAVEDMGGQVLGKKIRLIPIDHKVDPDFAVAEADRLRREENVDAFLDIIGSNVALPIQAYATKHNIAALQSTSATSKLTNELCSPIAVHWNYDSYSLVSATVKSLIKQGHRKWYFVSVDYALGHGLTSDARRVIEQEGGEVVGVALHPLRSADLSRQLLQARASGADVVAFANAGGDTINAIRQAYEIGLLGSDQKVVALLTLLHVVRSIGPYASNGLLFTTGFYWNYDDQTRAWSERFIQRFGSPPGMHHASTYSALLHYLKAVEATGTDDAKTVIAKMKEMPPNDPLFRNSSVRANGRMVHDMYLVRAKRAAEIERTGDYLQVIDVIPAEQAFLPLEESTCPLLKKNS